jgi:RNA polymerase sigma-70 factor, ECF subfamily
MLTELDGLTQASAAAQLGLSSSGMKSRVQRGRDELKELLTACCEIELDRRGGVRSYRPHRGPCDCHAGAPVVPGT